MATICNMTRSSRITMFKVACHLSLGSIIPVTMVVWLITVQRVVLLVLVLGSVPGCLPELCFGISPNLFLLLSSSRRRCSLLGRFPATPTLAEEDWKMLPVPGASWEMTRLRLLSKFEEASSGRVAMAFWLFGQYTHYESRAIA